MSVGALERPMGRKKSDKPRNDQTAKIDAGVLEMARFVALDAGVSLAELLTDMLRAPVERRYNEVLAKRNRAADKKR